jgi:RNA polymerase sigma-70 factor, ECF subfamily
MRRGREDAWNEGHALYRRYGAVLLRRCERVLRDRDDAQDVVQNLFVDLMVKRRSGVELGYLYRAATTRCLNVLRDRRRRRELLERHGPSLLVPRGEHLEERVMSMGALLGLLSDLDEVSAEILIYRYLDQMSQDEIAEVMSTSRKTIGKKLAHLEGRVGAWADSELRGTP